MALLRNSNTGAVLATRVERATSLFDRTVGLLARQRVRPDEGLWIERCGAIHTIGMRADIDVIFLDKAKRVLELHVAVRPFRLALTCRHAASVIELGAGAVDSHDILPGDFLELV
jgi:uncharacterized membrane protein (UPF0127 family)